MNVASSSTGEELAEMEPETIAISIRAVLMVLEHRAEIATPKFLFLISFPKATIIV